MSDSTGNIEPKRGWIATTTEARTRELVEMLRPGAVEIEYRTTGDSALAGTVDRVQAVDQRDELKVIPSLVPGPVWVDRETAVEELRGRPMRVVEADDQTTLAENTQTSEGSK